MKEEPREKRKRKDKGGKVSQRMRENKRRSEGKESRLKGKELKEQVEKREGMGKTGDGGEKEK